MMGKQFKRPVPDPEDRQSSISEQNTQKSPQVSPPGLPQHFAPANQPYKNTYGQPGVSPTDQPLPGTSASSYQRPSFMPLTAQSPFQYRQMQPSRSDFSHMAGGRVSEPAPDEIQMSSPTRNNRLNTTVAAHGKDARGKRKSDRRGRKKRRFPIWARVLVGFLTVLLLLTGGVYWYYQANFAGAINNITGRGFTRAPGSEDPNVGKPASILNWGRVNILLLGSDTDEKPEWGGNSFLAQTDIVLTIDTNTHDVGLLSIPRDFWITIPGHGLDKLDTAFAYGGSLGVNNNMSGVSKVVETLDDDFGIPINYYAWVGLNGFVNVINTVQGIDVDAMHPIEDDNYPSDVGNTSGDAYAYTRVYIPDGPQHMSGAVALEYVRSRHSTTDFNRSARQQQVLAALKLKLDNPGVIGELPQIVKDMQGSVYTQLQISQLIDLANFARGIDASKIRHLTLGPPYSQGATVQTASGPEDVVVPDCTLIVPAINQFLGMSSGKCDRGYSSIGDAIQAQAPSQADGTQVSASNVSTGNGADLSQNLSGPLATMEDLSGLRAILDLLSLVVLGSPQL